MFNIDADEANASWAQRMMTEKLLNDRLAGGVWGHLAQWRELIRQMAEQGLWEMVATLQSHANDTAKPERLPNQRTRPLK